MASTRERGEHPDTVFVNGRILTMDGDSPDYAEAVAISRGAIAFVGAAEEALRRFPEAVLRDLGGATMLPGFIDAHSHLSFGFDLVDRVNVGAPPMGGCSDIPSVIAALEAFRAERSVPTGGWLIGWGYDQEALTENRHITRHDIDAAFPEHRVALIHISSHGAVLGSRALEWAGIDSSTSSPPGGMIVRFDGSDEPTGLLMETAFLPVNDRLPHPDTEDRLESLDAVQQLYASEGYTHAQDGFASVDDLNFFRTAAERGLLYLDIATLGSFLELDEWLDDPGYPVRVYRHGFTIAGVKVVHDGSPQGRTAYLTKPYLTGGPGGEEQWRAQPVSPYPDLAAIVARALNAGVQVFVHANGDAAIDDLIEAVRDSGVTASDDHRTVAIHSQFQREDHLDSYVELGITPSYFTNHVYFWGDVHVANVGADRAAGISPMKSAVGRGLVVSNHSDFTVTPLNPFMTMWTAMARTTRTGQVLGPAERVDAYCALQALTTSAAHQVFEEHRKGRIAEGLLADFAILSSDPLEVGLDRVRGIEVVETIKEGVTVYRRTGRN